MAQNNSSNLVTSIPPQHFLNRYAPDSVTSGEAATFKVSDVAELEKSYFDFTHGAGVKATRANMILLITSIELILNNKNWFTITPAELFKLDDMAGRAVKDGRINLHWAVKERRAANDVKATMLQPFAINGGVEIRVNIALATATPTLKLWHWGDKLKAVDQAIKASLPKPLIRYKSFNWVPPIAGENVYTYKNGGAGIRAIHLTGADITKLIINIGSREWTFDYKDQLDTAYEEMVFNPQADTWHFIPEMLTGEVMSVIDMRRKGVKREIQFRITTSSINPVNFFVEEYEVPANSIITRQ